MIWRKNSLQDVLNFQHLVTTMKFSRIFLIILAFILSGCNSYRYRGMGEAEFSDSAAANRVISLKVSSHAQLGLQYINEFERSLESALLDTGFNDVQKGIKMQGSSVDVSITHDRDMNIGMFVLYMISLTAISATGDNILSFDVSYYNDGKIVRTASYDGSYVDYVSVYFPTALFMGASSSDLIRMIAGDLA